MKFTFFPCRLIAAAIIFALSCAVFSFGAENEDNSPQKNFSLQPNWKIGEKRSFEFVKGREKTKAGDTLFRNFLRRDLTIEVIDADDTAILVSWTFGNAAVVGKNVGNDSLMEKIAAFPKGYRMDLLLDHQADILGIRNWEDLRIRSLASIESMLEDLLVPKVSLNVIANLRTQFQSMLSTQEQVELFFTRDPHAFFAPLGLEFKNRQPLDFKDRLMNPFGGESFPCRSQVSIKEIDEKNDLAKINWVQRVSPDDTKRILKKMMEDISKRLGRQMPDENSIKTVAINDSAEYAVEISTGWPRYYKYERATIADDAVQKDIVTVTPKKSDN
jgi:hypothetical protein